MLDLADKPCPICGQIRNHVLHTTAYPEHHYPGNFTLYKCDGCGLLFNSPRLDGEELSQLYGRNYYFFLRDDASEFNRIVGMHQRTIGLLDTPPTRCIDIGCGRGYFPAMLKELGWQAAGIEISPDAAEYGRKKFGLDVFTGTVEQYRGPQFPLVTAIDVIEHVPSPADFVQAAAGIVETGGRLIIDTPNAAAQNINNKGVAWKGFNPFHIYLFTIDNLTALLSRFGLKVEKSFSYGNTPADPNLRDHLIGGLKSAGLLKPTVDFYFKLKKLTLPESEPGPLVKSAAQRIKAEGTYEQSGDHSAPLTATKTGDNIVVIARKD